MSSSPASSVEAAPVVSARPSVLDYPDAPRPLDCVYVLVETAERRDVAQFLRGWRRCCDAVSLEWVTISRPATALVTVGLHRCCGDRGTARMVKLAFETRRDRAALLALARTETLVVGTRPFGEPDTVVAYGVPGTALAEAVRGAERALARLGAPFN